MLVIDASFAIEASLTVGAFDRIRDRDAIAPPLLWSESLSVLHEMQWRGAISRQLAVEAKERLMNAPIHHRRLEAHMNRAWEIAEKLGWAKTYDAEYIAMAQSLACPLVTVDMKLVRAAANEVTILAPSDL